MSQSLAKETVVEGELAAGLDRSASGSIYYGWVMLPLSIATLIASSPAQTFGVSIFNEPMRASLGLSHGQSAAAYMLGTLLGALPIILVGRQMDRFGLRRTLMVVVTLFSLACVLTSLVQGWWTLMAAFFLLRMLGPGALALLSGNTLAFWFDRKLGMVEGFRKVGMAAAMATIPSLNLWLVAHWGWRGAYSLLGVGTWLILFPLVALYYRNRPADIGQTLDGVPKSASPSGSGPGGRRRSLTLPETLRTKAFWIVASGSAMNGLIHTALFFCLVPIFGERGLQPTDAAATLTLYAISLALMQFVGGMLADRFAARQLLCTGMLGLSLAVLVLFSAETRAAAFLAGAMLAVGQGLFFGAAQPLWARYFGRAHIGKIRGVLMTLNVASSSLGPLVAGLTRDWRGDFDLALLLFAAAPVPVALGCLLVQAPPRPRAEPAAALGA